MEQYLWIVQNCFELVQLSVLRNMTLKSSGRDSLAEQVKHLKTSSGV